MNSPALLEVAHLEKTFGAVHAVKDVSFSVQRGQVVGLVGESGSGKTTVGRMILRLIDATSGKITYDGRDITRLKGRELRKLRRKMQIIFQDPYSSLNPYMKVGDAIGEALEIHGFCSGRDRRQRVGEILELVGLQASYADRYPHEFSGGQRQRIGIGRALAVEPEFIVADEAVSALDISIQAQILNLLRELQQRLQLSILFIGHDLSVVKYLSDQIVVMYSGQVVERAPTEELFHNPRHPYTQALISAIPRISDRTTERIRLYGDYTMRGKSSGCPFQPRCVHALPECGIQVPHLHTIRTDHAHACIRDDLGNATPGVAPRRTGKGFGRA